MNSILLSPTLPLHSLQSSPSHPSQPPYINVLITTNNSQFGCISSLSLSLSIPSNSRHYSTSIVTALPSDEGGPVSVEDFMEKDWSFLDSDDFNSKEDHNQNISRIVSSARIEETSRVLVSIGSAGFVDRLLHTSPCSFLLVVHDSLFVLAAIKAKYDEVKCWQGELIRVPKKWVPLDVVFLYFLPALPFKLDQIFGTLAKCCSPGARLVISHPQGREVLEQQRKQYPDVVISELPDEMTLQKVAGDHSFEMVEFVDESRFYLAVLQFS